MTIQSHSYEQFLEAKAVKALPRGFEPCVAMPNAIKLFQSDIVTWACRRGRAAVFAATGLGKTLQELTWASQVVGHTQGQVLIFTPLAVAEQTVQEAAKFGVEGVTYSADHESISSPIVVTNYDRRHKFDLSRFAGIGSELYCAVQMKRRALGTELKASYWRQAVANLTEAENEVVQPQIFDELLTQEVA